jgi:hypothetical protein
MSEVGKTPIPRGAEEEGLNNQVVPLKSPVDPPPSPNAAEIHGFCAAVPEVRIHLPPGERCYGAGDDEMAPSLLPINL